jgi:hypothetical protein
MENRSRHYGDVSKWNEKVIESCETRDQTFSTQKLIHNFEKQIQRKSIEKYWREYHYDIIIPLEFQLSEFGQELMDKNIPIDEEVLRIPRAIDSMKVVLCKQS